MKRIIPLDEPLGDTDTRAVVKNDSFWTGMLHVATQTRGRLFWWTQMETIVLVGEFESADAAVQFAIRRNHDIVTGRASVYDDIRGFLED